MISRSLPAFHPPQLLSHPAVPAMESHDYLDCVFCDAEENAFPGVESVPGPSNAHRDPALETICALDQSIQAKTLYSPLDPLEEWQIRILELQPSPFNQTPLIGRLFNADILFGGGVLESGTRNRHTYTALSYYWGDDKFPRYHMTCDGVDFPIPIEAYRALHRIRDSRGPVYVWLDTVCINQHDFVNRSLQVAKMRSIYQNAQQVVVYLGEHSKPELSTFDAARSATKFVGGILQDYQARRSGLMPARIMTMTDRIRGRIDHGGLICDEHATLFERGLREISLLKWFNRVWIKQEVWAARSVEFRMGDSILEWQTLKSLREYFALLLPFFTDAQ